MHIVALHDGCDLEQHARLVHVARARNRTVQFEEFGRVTEEAGARPVRRRIGILGHGKADGFTTFRPRLRDAEQGGEAEWRRPTCVARVEKNLLVGRQRGELLDDLLEARFVERRRHGDDGRHVALSSPRR